MQTSWSTDRIFGYGGDGLSPESEDVVA